MFRFTIRDLFWLMLVVGFCLHAWTERFSRDVAWSRRVREEVLERAEAQERAKEAEERVKLANERAGRYAKVARQLQIEAILACHAARAAPTPSVPSPSESQPASPDGTQGGVLTGNAK